MLKGIGCDMVEVNRIERLLKDDRFVDKVYTNCEQTAIRLKSAQTAAGIWAAKEAVSKALGSGFTGFQLPDIEICYHESGQPYVKLHGNAQILCEKLGGTKIHLSITHERSLAMAFAVLEG